MMLLRLVWCVCRGSTVSSKESAASIGTECNVQAKNQTVAIWAQAIFVQDGTSSAQAEQRSHLRSF
eukprot:10011840-Karenia_brevis.AAC.1